MGNFVSIKEKMKMGYKKWYLETKKDPKRWEEYKKKINKFFKTPKGIYIILKRNSKKRSRDFDLTKEDFLKWYSNIEKKCFYCDVPEEIMLKIENKNGYVPSRLSIDRVDNLKSYSINNIVLACDLCNQIKGSWLNKSEMLKIGKLIVRPKWQNR